MTLGNTRIADALGKGVRWEISTSDAEYEMHQPSFREPRMEVRRTGSLIGQIARTSSWRTLVEVSLPDAIHPAIQTFVAVTAMVGWLQNEAVVGVSGGAGGAGP